MTLEFFLPMIPPTITHQQHQVRVMRGKPVFYDPSDLKAARQKFTGMLLSFAPEKPMAGPLCLITKWIWPFPGSDWDPALESLQRSAEHMAWKTTKPDTDNMIKLFKDCMTCCGFWKDDAQVASEHTEKFFGTRPGIYVKVVEL